MKAKKNYWKIASIILSVIAVVLFCYNVFYQPNYVFDDFGFSIGQRDFNSVSNALSYGQSAKLCSMETSKCIVVTKIG